MNKKLIPMALSMVVGIAMLVSTAYASVSETSGYDVYKTALKNMKTQENMTASAAVNISDNGKEFAALNASMKVNHEENAMSGNIAVQTGTTNQVAEIYRDNNNNNVIVTKEGYYLIDKQTTENHSKRFAAKNPEVSEAAEKVIDALVGDTKNYFNVEDLDNGLKEVRLNLTEDQIPLILNTLVSIRAQENNDRESFASNMELQEQIMGDIKTYLPELKTDVKIQNIELTAQINQENLIENQVLNITVAGKDIDGVSHTVVVSIIMNFSNFNQTAPDSIDLTGKDVTVVKLDQAKRHK